MAKSKTGSSTGSKSNSFGVIIIFGITAVLIIAYLALILFMYFGNWGFFAPYTPKQPGPDNEVFRPLGEPTPFTADEIKERQEIGRQLINSLNSTA